MVGHSKLYEDMAASNTDWESGVGVEDSFKPNDGLRPEMVGTGLIEKVTLSRGWRR